MSREGGFTLLEVLLSVAILAVLAGLSAPVYESFTRRNDLDLTAQSVAAAVRRAQTYARSGNYDSAWSVELQAGALTLFRGTDWAGRNTDYDEVIDFPGSVTGGGLTEVRFAQFNATPSTSGTITLTSSTSDTRTITINGKGSVDY